jgi:aspartyl-tRNA(Asn)/glutamyl-tRNA(Gln) amidotransferase subunit A
VSTVPDALSTDAPSADHPLDRGVAAIADLVRDRVISPAELVEEALARLSQWEPTLNAFITVCTGGATTRARSLAEAHPGARTALFGVPLAVKDNIDVLGERTTAGSEAINYQAFKNAPSVQRLHKAGAIVVGKSNLPELAYGPTDNYVFGPTWNPWKAGHFAGGSSMGSGAAVAAGIVPAALGSDTSGSLRNPAGWSGITGLKPTRGLIPVTGMVPLAPGLDHIGPMGRTALDCAILLDVMAGYHSTDPWSHRRAGDSVGYAKVATLPASPARIGVVQSLFDLVPLDAREVMETGLNTMAGLGARVAEVEIPLWEDAADAALLILACRAATTHADLLAAAPDLLTSQTRKRLEAGAQVSSVAYVQAELISRAFQQHLAATFEDVDYLVLPARERTAPPMDPDGGRPPGDQGHLFNIPFNLTGSPAIVMPVGFDTLGLPVGIQLVANRWKDASLLRYAHAYQSVTDWHTFRPPAPLTPPQY